MISAVHAVLASAVALGIGIGLSVLSWDVNSATVAADYYTDHAGYGKRPDQDSNLGPTP